MHGYRFQGATLAVSSDESAVLPWLTEFLAPGFEPWSGGEADFAVRIRTEASAYAAAAGTRPPGPLPERACFALDRDVVHHPSWTDAARTVLADGKLGALYRLGERQVEVIAGPGWLRTAAMRVVREIAATSALAGGAGLQLHAAVLEQRGRALAIAGPKAAGKTSVLCYLAARAGESGVRIVTNDRALATPARAGFDVLGVPTLVSVRPHTLTWLPRLARGLPDVERPGHLTLEEADAALANRGELREARRLKLSPPQLARQLGVALVAGAPLAAIVFPEAHASPEGFALERLDPAEAARRLPDALFGVGSGKTGATVFERLVGTCRPAEADRRGLEALAARVPCFRLRLGEGHYGDPGPARSILSTCLSP